MCQKIIYNIIMSKLNPIWNFIGHNKYWIVIIFGVLIVGFLDENSLLQHARNFIQIKEIMLVFVSCALTPKLLQRQQERSIL